MAYKKWYAGGYGPKPTNAIVHPLSTLASESITAINNAAAQWNSDAVGAGNLITISTEH